LKLHLLHGVALSTTAALMLTGGAKGADQPGRMLGKASAAVAPVQPRDLVALADNRRAPAPQVSRLAVAAARAAAVHTTAPADFPMALIARMMNVSPRMATPLLPKAATLPTPR
jgi:hypothetical protein